MSPSGLEPTVPASERPQTYALYHAAAGIGHSTVPSPIMGPEHPVDEYIGIRTPSG